MLHCGKIVNTHGIRGEVKVLCYADSPDFFDDVKKIYLRTAVAFIFCRAVRIRARLLCALKKLTQWRVRKS